jgi:Fe-S-cluster containining protein
VKFLCKIYETRPEACQGYPWNDANDLFPDCQFVKDGALIPLEQMQKPEKEISDFCISCGKCCQFWVDGKPIHNCSALVLEKCLF